MSDSETQLWCSEETRKKIRMIKAEQDHMTYDETLSFLAEEYDFDRKYRDQTQQ